MIKNDMPKLYVRVEPKLKTDLEVAFVKLGISAQSFFMAAIQLYGPHLYETKTPTAIIERARTIQTEEKEVQYA